MNKIYINILLFTTLVSATPNGFDLEKEQKKLSTKVFNNYDKNHDKRLSFQEFKQFSKEMKEKEQLKRANSLIKKCDQDGNGIIELTETTIEKDFRNFSRKNLQNSCPLPQMFIKRMDKNNDKTITREEIIASMSQPIEMIQPPFPMERVKKPTEHLKRFKERLEGCDKNKDKEISLIELTSVGCFMTSDTFLEYSPDPKKSFKIAEIKKAPKDETMNELEQMLELCDQDKNKEITLLEVTSKKCRMSSDDFLRSDRDKNELLSIEEFKMMLNPTPKQQKFTVEKNMPVEAQINIAYGMCDSNRDHKLSKEEAKSCELSLDIFNKFDGDKSGTIERNDLENMRLMREFELVDNNENKELDLEEFAERMGSRCRVF